MIKNITHIFLSVLISISLSGCGRDLSARTYTSDSTLNISLRGKVLAKREIVIREDDKLADNTMGAMLGAASGGLAVASSNHSPAIIVGGAIVGGVTGAIIQSALGTSKGMEYIVEVDRSNLRDDYYEGSRLIRNALAAIRATGVITIIQGKEVKGDPTIILEGQNVLIILSEKRTRLIPATY